MNNIIHNLRSFSIPKAILFFITTLSILPHFAISPQIFKHYNLNIREIGLFFFISSIFSPISKILSGMLFDYIGRLRYSIYITFTYLLSCITLLLSFYDICFLYIHVIISALNSSGIYGTLESSIYMHLKNKNKIQHFTSTVSIFYGMQDVIRSFGTYLVGFLIAKSINHNMIIYALLVQSLITIIAILVAFKDSKAKTRNSNYRIYFKEVYKFLLTNSRALNRIITFAIYVSIMFYHHPICVMIVKHYNLSNKVLYNIEGAYYLFMGLGSIVPILIGNNLIQKYKKAIVYYVPCGFFIALAIFSYFNMPVMTMVVFSLISFSFCIFEVCLEFDIDRSSNQDIMGISNTFIWFIASIIKLMIISIINIANSYNISFNYVIMIPFVISSIAILFSMIQNNRLLANISKA